MEQLITQLWQCPLCEVYFEDEDTARDHCELFTLFDCGKGNFGDCEHLTESEAIICQLSSRRGEGK